MLAEQLSSNPSDWNLALTERLHELRFDPLGAIRYGFPWGEGELQNSSGPWEWAEELLIDVGKHLQNPETRYMPGKFARASGHGIGKSATVAQIIWWGMSCFLDPRIIVTANTKTQLDTKTQPEVAKWFRMALNSDDFEVNVASIKARDPLHDRSWRTDFIPWSEDNPQAFAGLHNAGRIIIVVCDEASEISDIIFEVIQGAMTDANTIILWFQFGNPTRLQGFFYESIFGTQRHRWNLGSRNGSIDSRDVEGSNKEEIKQWVEDYGEDSDFVRVRVRGLPPRAASGQYIDQGLILQAQKRPAVSLPDDPLVAGVDFAWGGSDDNVVRFRKGMDARSVPPIKIKGEFTRDPAVMVGKLSDVLSESYNGDKIAMLFFDAAGIAAPVYDRLLALGFDNITLVNYGAHSPDPRYAFMRDFCWGKMKEAMQKGLAIDDDPALASDLAKPILVSDPKQRVKLEPKDVMKRRLAKMGVDSSSPDDGDSLASTWAFPVAPMKQEEKPRTNFGAGDDYWMA